MQQILQPVGEGTYTAWSLGAGASKTAAVDPGDPVTHDADTSYIYYTPPGGAGTGINSFYLEAPPGVNTVTQFDVYVRARRTGLPTTGMGFFVRRDTTDSSSGASGDPGTSYSDMGDTNVVRPNSGSWVAADFVANNIQLCVSRQDEALGDADMRCTSLWGELTFEPVITGFRSTLISLLPWVALVGGLGPRDMPGLCRQHWLASGRRIKITPDEYARALAELREYRYPRTFAFA